MQDKVDVIYMDLKKVLDSGSYDGLLQKLYIAGKTGKLWFWLQTYIFKAPFQVC